MHEKYKNMFIKKINKRKIHVEVNQIHICTDKNQETKVLNASSSSAEIINTSKGNSISSVKNLSLYTTLSHFIKPARLIFFTHNKTKISPCKVYMFLKIHILYKNIYIYQNQGHMLLSQQPPTLVLYPLRTEKTRIKGKRG